MNRKEVEKALIFIWQQLLGKQTSINDNFFQLGGNSFLATQVSNRLKRLGYHVSLRDIFAYPTIAKLSERIENSLLVTVPGNDKYFKGDKQQYNSVLPIRSKGHLPPIFVVHNTWIYIKLALQLGDQQPFYCLVGGRYSRIEDLAAFYITKMKGIQPKGPYYIGGYCGYGFVALEIARQLTMAGELVETLFLFETYSPRAMLPRLSWKYTKLSYRKFAKWPSLNRKKYLKDELRQMAKTLLCATVRLFTKRDLVKNLSGKIVLVQPRPSYYNYSGKVVLFKASGPEIWAKDEPQMGWSQYFDGDVEVITIEGSHSDIFQPPGVLKVAEIIKSIMKSSRNRSAYFPLLL